MFIIRIPTVLVFFLIVDAVPGGPGLGRMFNVGFYLLLIIDVTK